MQDDALLRTVHALSIFVRNRDLSLPSMKNYGRVLLVLISENAHHVYLPAGVAGLLRLVTSTFQLWVVCGQVH